MRSLFSLRSPRLRRMVHLKVLGISIMEFFKHLSTFLFVVHAQFHSIYSTPSIDPDKPFDAKAVAEKLHEALNTGTDGINDEGVNSILTKITCLQRVEVADALKAAYNQDMEQTIRSETGGSYERLLLSSFACDENLYAIEIRHALQQGSNSWDVDGFIQRKTLIEIMVTCSESKETHDKLLEAYTEMSQSTLETFFGDNLDGDFKSVMLEMVKRVRRPQEPTDEAKAQEVAQQLNDGRKKWEDERELLDSTLMETPFEQLELVFQKFKEISGNDLETVIDDKLSASLKNTYQDLIHFCKTYKEKFVGYYATRFHEALNGAGTDEITLMRLCLIHSEKDIREIEDKYKADHGESLDKRIQDDTQGSFKDMLLGYIKGNTASPP